MPYYGTIEVVNHLQWTKSFSLEKGLLMVGTADHNDIVLPDETGKGIAPVHLQLMRPKLEVGRIRVINLGNTECPYFNPRGREQSGSLAVGGTVELESGMQLKLGDYTISLGLRVMNGINLSGRSEHLGIRLELPSDQLNPGEAFTGVLTASNYGSERCQFMLDMTGLPQDCYQIDSSPILFANSEEQLYIRLFHRGTRPAGGTHELRLRAIAPSAYPTEEVTITFEMKVAAVRQFEMEINDSPVSPWQPEEAAPRAAPAVQRPAPEAAPARPAPQPPVAQPPVVVEASQTEEPVQPAPVTAEPPAAGVPKKRGRRMSKAAILAEKSEAVGQQLFNEPIEPPDVPAEPVEEASVASTGPAPGANTAESDWWGESQPQEASIRIGRVRKNRLSVSTENIQVLRSTPEDDQDEDAAKPTEEQKP